MESFFFSLDGETVDGLWVGRLLDFFSFLASKFDICFDLIEFVGDGFCLKDVKGLRKPLPLGGIIYPLV